MVIVFWAKTKDEAVNGSDSVGKSQCTWLLICTMAYKLLVAVHMV